jgi:flagellar biosynthetic protein FliR
MTAEQQVLSFLLILARVSAFIGFLPIFAQKQLPQMVKAGLAVALTTFWFGSLPPNSFAIEQINGVTSTLLIAKEVGIGFLLAVVLGFMFVPAKIAGAYVGQEMGLSLAAVSSPAGPDSSTLLTSIFEMFTVLLFFGLNFHYFIIVLLHYSLIQLSARISLLDLPTEGLVSMTSGLFENGNLIVGPVGLCLFIITVGLALLNKAAPTLNLFSVGMALRSWLGILCLAIFMPVILKSVEMYFKLHIEEIESLFMYFE